MGRRSISFTEVPEKPVNKIDTLIDSYYDNNKNLGSLKKLVDTYKEELKAELANMMVDSYVNASGLEASITYVETNGFDEAKAIEILKATLSEEDLKNVVKSREYIDDEALETLIYNKQLDAAILSPCTIVKPPSARLYVKRAK